MYKISLAKKVFISLFLLVLFSKPTAASEKLAPVPIKQGTEIFVQLGHSSNIESVAFSWDGKYMASGSSDNTIKLWEVSSGKEIRTLKGHGSSVIALAFLRDGKSLASAGGESDETIRIWEIATGKETFKFPTNFFKDSGRKIVQFSENGAYAIVARSASSSFGGDPSTKIKVVETATGREVMDLSGIRGAEQISASPPNYPSRSFERAIFSPDGKQVLAVFDYSLKLLDVKSGKVIRTYQAEKYPLSPNMKSAAFSPDGKLILSSTFGDGLVLFDTATGRVLAMFGKDSSPSPDGVLFSPDGKYAVSAKTDPNGGIQFWDIASRRMVKTITHGSYISTGGYGYIFFAFTPSGAYLASGGKDKTVKLWDIRSGAEVRKFSGAVDMVLSVDVSPDGRYALSTTGREIILWDIATGRKEKVFRGHADIVNVAKFSPDGKFALSASGRHEGISDNTLRLWDISTGKEIRKFMGHMAGIVSISFSPDGKFALSGGSGGEHDRTTRLWDVATGTEIKRFDNTILVEDVDYSGKKVKRDAGGGAFLTEFSRDGKITILSRGNHIDIYKPKTHYDVYDTSTWRKQRTITVGGYSGSTLSPDGNYLLVGHQLIEVLTGNKRREYDNRNFVNSVAFSPDMNYFAQGVQVRHEYGWDGRLEIRETDSGRVVKTLDGHIGDIYSVKFTADGRHVLSSGHDGTVRVWDASTGKELAQFISFTDGEWIVITPGGYYNSSANGDKHLNVRIGNNVYGIENYREAFFRPDLVKVALSGGSLKDFKTLADVKQPPRVEIVKTPQTVDKDKVTVTVRLEDLGGGIGDIRLYLNGSAVVLDSARGVKIIPKDDKVVYKTYALKLTNGLNTIRAIAFNAENTMQSNDVLHEITATFKSLTKPSLNAIIVGINEYKNPKLQLKYAVSDAELFENTLKKVTAGLFEKVNIKKLVTKEKTTNENIIKELKAYKALNPDDVFVFFVASHGTVDNGEYFLITSNVGSTRTEKLKTDALSQVMLKELIANIPATKKLIIIDTCSAGALGEAIQVAMLTRGMSEDTAMKILSRAVGSTILSASTSLQEAVEGYQGHGLFTYVLVEGLKGKADKGKTGYVKTTELADYVDSEVPVLAEKVFKKAQYPTISISGQAFPIGKTGK